MEISLSPKTLQEWKGAVLVVGLTEGSLHNQLAPIENLCQISLKNNLEQLDFTAKTTEVQAFSLLTVN